VIDMGPEAGDEGGCVVTCGTPEDLVAYAKSWQIRHTAGDRAIPLRSYTSEALVPVLEAGPYVTRTPFDEASVMEERPGDRDITEVGRDTKMPWEVDGRRWHAHDRVGRKGEPCRWDGRILEAVVDRIQQQGTFSETDWNSRSVVEIAAEKKSVGWFFHAITGETWLLKMKFRVAKNTFQRHSLIDRLPLKTLNQLDEVPLYGNEPRVKCRSLRGPWQEVQISAHSWEEIDIPEFWSFLDEAVDGFQKFTALTELKLEDHMPWKKLGQRWHFMRKGFSPGKRILWDVEVWEELYEILQQCAPDGQFLWNNQVLVHLLLKSQRDPWITICTKRCESLDMTLIGPKGGVTLGRIAEIAHERELDATAPDRDFVRLRFRTVEDLHKGDLVTFLEEHKARRMEG
jgi:excinuclease ABC subunit A